MVWIPLVTCCSCCRSCPNWEKILPRNNWFRCSPGPKTFPSIANSNNFNRFELLMGALFFIPHGGLWSAYYKQRTRMEGCSMNEKTKFRLEICSLLLSLFAIIISIASFVYTVYKDSLESTEQISIVNAGYGYDEFMIYNSAGGYRGQGMI